MILSRSDKSKEKDNPLENPAFILGSIRHLMDSEEEFPIKVEGTSTMPYTSVVKELRQGLMVLKLIRPLPHELMKGAVFQMVFPYEDKRYQALCVFQGREGYLQYGFTLPSALTHADRRAAKRFPFRPRESAYVIAQDARIPAMGLAGPLVNIGMGGCAMRVDRVLMLDTGMRVPPSTALFDRDKGFPRLRIQDLPKLPALEWRGIVTHASPRGEEVILGFSFGELGEDEARALGDCLTFREKAFRGGAPGVPSAEGAAPAPRKARAPESATGRTEAPLPDEAAETRPDPLALLQRRTCRVVLGMAEGERRTEVVARLSELGFLRLECLSSLDELKARLPGAGWALVDLGLTSAGDEEPLAGVRALEKVLGDLGGTPLAMLCERMDPTLLLATEAKVRVLSYQPQDSEELLAWEQAVESLSAS